MVDYKRIQTIFPNKIRSWSFVHELSTSHGRCPKKFCHVGRTFTVVDFKYTTTVKFVEAQENQLLMPFETVLWLKKFGSYLRKGWRY